jgi:hypothetical protein
MSEAKHTKEPWVSEWQDGEDSGHWIYNTGKGGDEYAIAVTFLLNPKAEQDARRIVACVNRLAPFTTEQIENGIDLVAQQQRITSLEAQNKELREALCKIIHAAGDGNVGVCEFINLIYSYKALSGGG